MVLPPDSEMSDQTEYDVLITRPVCSSTGVPVLDQRDESTPDQQPPWRGGQHQIYRPHRSRHQVALFQLLLLFHPLDLQAAAVDPTWIRPTAGLHVFQPSVRRGEWGLDRADQGHQQIHQLLHFRLRSFLRKSQV